ncbi:DedA family protein [Paenibacillus pinistramenti]|uniref:DedA family protein n=1 Tax=Paenibacillus pinistramenti TaxID=1768003 RepID=UPI001108FC56|nr:DedA family protein [Paenibacillus pinistramenti]
MNIVHDLEVLFREHGYFVIWIGLLLEFIALPFPGETTMAYAGFIAYKGLLDWKLLILFSFLGTAMGITITYWIGRKAGLPFFRRFGKWFFLPPHKLEKTSVWFNKYGSGLIFIGYFIPGVRHFTGYFAGSIALPFRKFMLYAYSGALVWAALFVSIGKVFGPQWKYMFELAAHYSAIASAVILLAIVLIVLYRCRRSLRSMYKARFSPAKPQEEVQVQVSGSSAKEEEGGPFASSSKDSPAPERTTNS